MLKRKFDHGDEKARDKRQAPPVPLVVAEPDPRFVHMRMLVLHTEARQIIGAKGSTIHRLKDISGCQIHVSGNDARVLERTVSVRGPAEQAAKAMGLIVRVMLGEELHKPLDEELGRYTLRCLIPHPVVGYIIGKLGLMFRDIEEKLALRLSADEHALPFLNDRVLHIVGVADAIHIAGYYVCKLMVDHRDLLTKELCQHYDPLKISYHHYYFPMTPIKLAYPMVPQVLPTMEKTIIVPRRHIGCVIGKGGSNLVSLRQRSGGCYVKVLLESPEDKETRRLSLQGTDYMIDRVERLIWGKVNFEEARYEDRMANREAAT